MTTVDGVWAIVFDIGGTLLNSADGTLTDFRCVLHDVVDGETIETIATPS